MSSSVDEQLRTSDGKDRERAVKKDSVETENKHGIGRGNDHHSYHVEEEVQSYALENAFSWPVSLVMGLNHGDQHHRSHPKPKHEKLEKKEVRYTVENAFSWPVSFAMHVVNENQIHRGIKQGSKKQARSPVTENVESKSH
ncbi:hypothetical protein R1flu_002026 [Riccia fluitans]|uniref:Uncharacterized protein n=1 Tax=Riccia fluitans TaxID=41844 RepID=A0ABD1Y4Z5_9MARC